MGDFFKKMSSDLANRKLKNLRGSPGAKEIQSSVTKSYLSDMSKEYGKKLFKKVATSKIGLVAGAFFLKFLIIMIAAGLLIFPLSYAMILYQGALDSFNEFTLKTGTTFKNNITSFFSEKRDYDKLDKVAGNYEKFLIDRFEYLNDKIFQEKYTPKEAQSARDLAVGWVYGKIYSDFFKAPTYTEQLGAWLFGDLNDLTQTWILKPISETATEVYVPEKGSNVEDSRKEVFGDSINLYDIEAFDYLAGTLYDLMELDFDALRKDALEKNKEKIELEVEQIKLEEARKQTKDIILQWASKLTSLASNGKGSKKHIKDLGLDSTKLQNYGKISTTHNLHTFMKDTYSYSSSTNYKWFINTLDSLDSDGCEKNANAEKVAKALITKSSDIEKLSSVASEIESVYVEFIKSFGDTVDQQTTLRDKAKETLSENPFQTIYKKYYDNYVKKSKDVQTDTSNDVAGKEIAEIMKEKITELNLTRTQQAALTYRDYLTALEDVTTIKYHSFNMENEIFNTLYNIPYYTLEFFTNHANSKKDVDSIISSDKYYKGLKLKIEDMDSILNLSPRIKEQVIWDNNKNPILSGVDTSTGTDYLSSTKDLFISELYNIIGDSIKELQDIKLVLDSARDPNSKEYQQIIGSLEERAWKDVEETYAVLKTNPFLTFRIGITDWFTGGEYDSRVENFPAFEQDILNHTRNSMYWKEISAGVTNANNGRPTQYSPLPIPYIQGTNNIHNDEQPFYDFARYMSGGDSLLTVNTNEYLHYVVDYNEVLTTLSNHMSYIDLLNGEPTAGGKLSLDDFFDKANLLISKEIEKLNNYKNTIKTLEKVTLENNTGGVFVISPIETVYVQGIKDKRNDDYIGEENELKVMKFKYTQEEAVRHTAEKCFPDVVAKMKGNANNQGIVMDIGDMKIGEQTIPGAKYYDSYKRALEYLDTVEQVVKENGDLIDPYYIIAMIAAESSGIERPYNPNDANFGIMQIDSKKVGTSITLPKGGEPVVIDGQKLAEDPKYCIEIGLAIAIESASRFDGNLFMGITGYNMGDNAMDRIIFLTLVGQGKVDKNVWTSPPSTWHTGITNSAERERVSKLMKDYMRSGDLDWLNYRIPYQEENWFGGGVGTHNHLERVLDFYNTSQGMPWYRAEAGGPKIIMGSSGGADVSLGTDENGNKSYHKNNRLVLWKEYFTESDVFKNVDSWFSKNAEIEKEKAYLLSSTITEAINTIDTRFEDKLKLLDIKSTEFKAIIAGTINTGATVLPQTSSGKAIVSQPGFKVEPATTTAMKVLIDSVILDYIDIYSGLNGKDRDFALYIYFSNDRNLAKLEIASQDGSFADFIKNKYKEEQESFTTPSSVFVKIAQTLSGDLNVDVKNFFNLIDNIGSGSEDTVILNPLDIYVEEWLKAKYLMHESYNLMISQTNAERIAKNKDPFPLLPTYQEVILNKNNNEDDVEVILTVKGPNGELHTVQVRKKFLTTQPNSSNAASYIVIHDTGDSGLNGSATKRYDIMNSSSATETMHYVVGSSDILHMTENTKAANHINDSATSTGGTMHQITNSNSLGIQFEANVTRNKDKVFWHTVAITKYLMEQNNITDYDKVVLHNDVTGIEDSQIMLKNDKEEWIKFKDALKNSTVTFSINNGSLAGSAYKLVETALSYLGHPYVYGAEGQILTDSVIEELESVYKDSGEYNLTPRKYFDGTYRAFDCSGFVKFVYSQNGIELPRSTDAQEKAGKSVFKPGEAINISALQPGDLLYSPGHVVMWIGNGEYIHATQPGDVVKIGKGIYPGTYTVRRHLEVGSGKFMFYSQHDSKWDMTYCGEPLARSGCGPTSTAMVLSGLKYTNSTKIDTNGDGIITPKELAQFSIANNTFDNRYGTLGEFYDLVGAELNIPVRTIWAGDPINNADNVLAELKASLKAGKAIVASYQYGHWIKADGHLIALVGIDNLDRIIAYDPNLPSLNATYDGRFNGPNPDSNIVGPGTGAYFFKIFG